jgi:hypothetical protein
MAKKKIVKKSAPKKVVIKKVVKKTAPKKTIKKSAPKKVVIKKVVKKTASKKAIGLNTIKPNKATIDRYKSKNSLDIKRFHPKSEIMNYLTSTMHSISNIEKNIFNLGLMIKNPQNKNIKISLKKDLSIYKSLLKEKNIQYKELKKLL